MVSISNKFIFNSTEISAENYESFKKILTNEIINCRYRFLHESKLWLTELLFSKFSDLSEMTSDSIMLSLNPYFLSFSFSESLFLKGEYKRCAHHLRNLLGKHSVLDFIYFFARFKASLKYLYESENDWMNNESQKYIDDLIELKEDLEEHMRDSSDDAYLLYLHGMVLKKLDLKKDAKTALTSAIEKHNFLWSAWYELADLVEYNDPNLPTNWMRKFFEVKALKLLNNKDASDEAINSLIHNGFEKFDDLKIDLAVVNEQKNNSVFALELFKEVYERDPYRMEHFGTFSNILYLQENHNMLAQLAQSCIRNDRYRPETCCVVGNFYSLRNQHEKAVLYFQRSLKLNPAQSNVWLLAAHEYVELDNFNAGVQCYYKAIEHNQGSYRAWYGLGQLYELFKNFKFALLCYQKGFELMPSDSRILVGLGNVYEELGRNDDAKICFTRAHSIGDVEHIALVRLGKVLEKMKEMKDAAAAFNLFVEEVEEEGFSALQNLSYANMFLANYHCKFTKNFEKARHFANKCCEIPDSKMMGEELLRKISSLDKNDVGFEIVSQYYELESVTMNKLPSDDNLVSNAMNLSLGDDVTENDEAME